MVKRNKWYNVCSYVKPELRLSGIVTRIVLGRLHLKQSS